MSVSAILKQYKENSKNSSSNKMSNEERLKQYFATFLPKGVNSLKKKIRILPVEEGKSPFIEVKGHKAEVGGNRRTLLCPLYHKDEDCPFCEAREALLSTGEKEDKDLAKKYYPRLMYVVKVIDREKEDDGPKFWRFNHDFRKAGALDKIMGVIDAISDSSSPDLTDSETGRDLTISINRDQNGYPIISSIVQGDPKPLHSEDSIIDSWVNDDRTWEDVYSMYPYDYLEIVVKGGEPKFQKNESGEGGKWIDKNLEDETTDDNDDELTIGGDKPSNDKTTNDKESEVSSDNDDDDDLPF